MLDRYLESRSTTTEKLTFYQAASTKTSVSARKKERRKEMKKTLDSWETSWEKAE
jgi:hypothetical protein